MDAKWLLNQRGCKRYSIRYKSTRRQSNKVICSQQVIALLPPQLQQLPVVTGLVCWLNRETGYTHIHKLPSSPLFPLCFPSLQALIYTQVFLSNPICTPPPITTALLLIRILCFIAIASIIGPPDFLSFLCCMFTCQSVSILFFRSFVCLIVPSASPLSPLFFLFPFIMTKVANLNF